MQEARRYHISVQVLAKGQAPAGKALDLKTGTALTFKDACT